MWEDHTLLSVARLASALLAALLFIAALGAYQRTRRRSLLALALGAGFLGLGYLIAGSLVEILGWSVNDATMVESLFTLFAVALLVASLYLREPVRRRVGRPSGARATEAEVAHV